MYNIYYSYSFCLGCTWDTLLLIIILLYTCCCCTRVCFATQVVGFRVSSNPRGQCTCICAVMRLCAMHSTATGYTWTSACVVVSWRHFFLSFLDLVIYLPLHHWAIAYFINFRYLCVCVANFRVSCYFCVSIVIGSSVHATHEHTVGPFFFTNDMTLMLVVPLLLCIEWHVVSVYVYRTCSVCEIHTWACLTNHLCSKCSEMTFDQLWLEQCAHHVLGMWCGCGGVRLDRYRCIGVCDSFCACHPAWQIIK